MMFPIQYNKEELMNLSFSKQRELILVSNAGSYSSTTLSGCNFEYNHFEKTKKLQSWKQKIMKSWGNVKVLSVNAYDSSNHPFPLGNNLSAQITLDTNGLDVDDLGVEIIFKNKKESEINPGKIVLRQDLLPSNIGKNNVLYEYSIQMTRSGVFEYGFRIYPKNDLLAQPMDFGLVKWI